MPHSVSNVLRSPGHPLDAATRAFFEPRFGHDFSHVRVHTDAEAAASARSINALAYTAGEHLFFDSGQYAPATGEGKHLLAHELTHALQSRSTPSKSPAHSEAAAQGDARIFRNPGPPMAIAPSSSPPAVLDDLIRQTPEGFTDSVLDSAYQDYVRKNPSGHADPRNWALRQTSGAPRDRLQTLLGPTYAVGQRSGSAQPPVNVLEGDRPPDYSDPRLAKDIETLKEQPRIVLDRLQNLIATPVLNGQIGQGHFSILQGNVAEALAQPQLQQQLEEVRRTDPDAQLFLGVRARVKLKDGSPSDPVQFTDGLIASVRNNKLYVHRVAEVKSGAEGGAEAQEQVHRWIEGHSTLGIEIILPGIAHEFVYSDSIREVFNLTTAPRLIITPQGARYAGEASGHKVAARTIPIELSQTPEQIEYLTRLVARALIQHQQSVLQYQRALNLAKQAASNALTPASLGSYSDLLDAATVQRLQTQNNGLALIDGRLYRANLSGNALNVRLLTPSLIAVPQALPSGGAAGTAAIPKPSALPRPNSAGSAPSADPATAASRALPAPGAATDPLVIPQGPPTVSNAPPPNILNFTGQPIVAGGRTVAPSEIGDPVVGDVVVVGFNNYWIVSDTRTNSPIAGVFEGGTWYRVTSAGHALPLDSEGRIRTEVEPVPFEHLPSGYEPLQASPTGESQAAGGASGGTRVVAGGLGIFVVAEQILAPIGQILNVQRRNIALGEANAEFWTRFGGNPSIGVWDQGNRAPLDPRTKPSTSVFGSPSYRYVADIDVKSLRATLPGLIHNYQEFLLFMDLSRTISAIRETPPMTDFPTAEERRQPRTYSVRVGEGDSFHWVDITDIIRSVEKQNLDRLDLTMRATLRGLPDNTLDNVFRLKGGSETHIFRSANGQPILSGQQVFGPDPWVRPVGESVSGGLWKWFRRGHYSARVLVEAANADAERSSLVSAYQITQSIEDTLDEAKEGGRPILKRDPEEGHLDSFVAGPGPEGSRFGTTRYYRHPQDPRWTVAIGELRQFWVNEDDLEPVPRPDVKAYEQPVQAAPAQK